MHSFRIACATLGLAALAFGSCDGRNQVASWENQTFINAGWNTPSSPLVCHQIWNDTKAAPLQFIRERFGITRFSLQSWNCFLDSADGMSIPNVGYCVHAAPEQTSLPPPPPPPTQPPKQPSPSQPVEPVPLPTASNLVTLWPKEEEASSAAKKEVTSQSTPRPSLTTLTDVTASNPVFDRLAENTTLAAGATNSSASYKYSTWSTVTNPRESVTTVVGPESAIDAMPSSANSLQSRNQSDIARFGDYWRNDRPVGFATSCDDPEGMTNGTNELCYSTRVCDAEDEWPTCDDGNCRCRRTFCSKTSECENLNICRLFDQKAHCELGTEASQHNGKDGTCTCRPKYQDCALHGMHSWCAEKFNCTAWSVDVRRLPTCVVKGAWSGCECKHTECAYSNWWNETAHKEDSFRGDASACDELQCPDMPELWYTQTESACEWNPQSPLNGTCGCKDPE